MQILARLKRIEKRLMENKSNSDATTTQSDNVGGINVSLLPAKDEYAYALILLDAFFTKEELSQSLMVKTTKSPKPALDEKRIQRLIHLVEKRYPGKLDLKVLKNKINQKCRDSGVVKVKKEKQKVTEEKEAVKEEVKEAATDVMEGSSSGATRPSNARLYKPFTDIDSSSDDDE